MFLTPSFVANVDIWNLQNNQIESTFMHEKNVESTKIQEIDKKRGETRLLERTQWNVEQWLQPKDALFI